MDGEGTFDTEGTACGKALKQGGSGFILRNSKNCPRGRMIGEQRRNLGK